LVLDGDGKEILIPFREEIILEINLDENRFLARPPEGLLDL
jgi:ribosomal 30S subunit maturation factor RimM